MFERKPANPMMRRAALQLALLCCALPLCFLAARPFLDGVSWIAVHQGVAGLTAQQWGLALLASMGSFAALGRYDVIAHRILGSDVAEHNAQASGAAAVALSQTLGFGLITGTIARWRALPGLSLAQAGAITSLVSFSFLGAWLLLFACAGLAAPQAMPFPQITYLACLISALCFLLFTVVRRHITILGRRLRLPSLYALGAMICFAAVDTGCAALALWFLLPGGVSVSYGAVFAIYLACLGLSLISNAPSGLGPFEVSLLWALQAADANDVLAALVAFRLIYFALPACLGALYLLRPLPSPMRPSSDIMIADSWHPETPAALQTGEWLRLPNGQQVGAVGRTTQCYALLFDPAVPFNAAWRALKTQAASRAQSALFYKLGGRNALAARRSGMAVLRIASDAVVDLNKVDTERPRHRRLRRKLKAAERSALQIAPLSPVDPEHMRAAAQLDRDWQARAGKAQGFSMGRFCPEYLSEQLVLGAWHKGALAGLITLHRAHDIWALDLMRSAPDMPDGTMHALVWRAICDARRAGCRQVSLAASPALPARTAALLQRIGYAGPLAKDGLRQFKNCFSPRWVPLYAAAATAPALALALWDVWREVRDPPPLRGASAATSTELLLRNPS